ncbi:MAG: alanine dehydrogenase [Synechocystis sp.]|nr:alanine dehydrogenase [Synechocystis sp.]
MEVGVPKEIKDQEFRVGLTPASVRALVDQGHQVFVEQGAGLGSSFPDGDYQRAGATVVETAEQAWQRQLVVKVKEPLPQEYGFLSLPKLLFTYLHLAADRRLTEALLKSGVTAIAYETVELENGQLPLLSPMSRIAGRLAVQMGAHYLEKQQGGRGVLLGGVPGVPAGQVTILGGGIVGTEAAKMAVGLGATVSILDINVDRLNQLGELFGSRIDLRYSSRSQIDDLLPRTDLLIGAVLVPGKRAPILVSRDQVETLPKGAVILDVAIDQGGCVETLKVTSHSQPSYVEAGVVHVGIPNMPGATPWTATQALNNSTLPYVLRLAHQGPDAWADHLPLAKGVNIQAGQLIHPAVKTVFPDL